MSDLQPTPKRIEWLKEHIPAFKYMHEISQRIAAEEAENRAKFERKN